MTRFYSLKWIIFRYKILFRGGESDVNISKFNTVSQVNFDKRKLTSSRTITVKGEKTLIRTNGQGNHRRGINTVKTQIIKLPSGQEIRVHVIKRKGAREGRDDS